MDCVRGIEIAIDDFGGKIKGHGIKLSAHDSRCNNAGGRKAAKKIASDPTIVAAIGSNCSSAATRIVVYETKIENIKKGKMPTKPFWKKR